MLGGGIQRFRTLWSRLREEAAFRELARRRARGETLPIFFCLNSGRCGSTSLTQLLRRAGLSNCFHERAPDLLELGLEYYQRRVTTARAAEVIRGTRAGVYFEANNRLFAMTGPILQAFPTAKFLFLHRDGRDVVRSGLQRRWYQADDRFGARRLGSQEPGTPFEKTCRYWVRTNTRIMQDLVQLNCDYLAVPFNDLAQGTAWKNIAEFMQFDARPAPRVPLENSTSNFKVPTFSDWPSIWKKQFVEICGPTMRRLGYEC